jgi:hypothetical protein
MHTVGRRGTFLLFLTILDFVYGYSLLYPTPLSITSPTSVFLAEVLPLWVWGWLWVTVGIICCIFAFRQKDAPGFAAGIFLKILWGTIFLLGWTFAGVERGYLSSTIWIAFAGVLAIIASWPEPRPEAD